MRTLKKALSVIGAGILGAAVMLVVALLEVRYYEFAIRHLSSEPLALVLAMTTALLTYFFTIWLFSRSEEIEQLPFIIPLATLPLITAFSAGWYVFALWVNISIVCHRRMTIPPT